MDVFFFLLPGLVATGAIFTAAVVVRRAPDVRRARNRGVTAEACCPRAYTTSGGGETSVSTT